MVRFYASFIRPGDLCFDLGSHVGSRIRAWLQLGASVVAVEPQPACTAVLRKFYRSNPSVVIVEAGVGSVRGQAELHISTRSPRISTLSQQWIQTINRSEKFVRVKWDRSVEVPVITLDDLISKYGRPRFCKIDIEGHELEALVGLTLALPALSFEYVLPRLDLAEACIDRLESIAPYEYNWSFGELLVFDLEQWIPATEMKRRLLNAPPRFRAGDIYARIDSSKQEL